jgi:hypothetical protein
MVITVKIIELIHFKAIWGGVVFEAFGAFERGHLRRTGALPNIGD